MMSVRPLIRLALCGALALAACEKPCRQGLDAGDGTGLAGTSVGCGNPPRVAELHPSEVNGCPGDDCGNTGRGPVLFRIALGETLDLGFEFRVPPASQRVSIHIYAADQIPMFRKAPLDSFSLTSEKGFLLKPGDLDKAIKAYDPGLPASGLFAFNVHIRLTEVSGVIEYGFEALLAGLGLDRGRGLFISSEVPSWGTGTEGWLLPADAVFQGKVTGSVPGPGLSPSSASFAYIPGSPFATGINPQDSSFRMGNLARAGYELRMISIPAAPASNRRTPVLLLGSRPDSLPNRPFRVVGVVDTVTIPDNF